MLTGPQLEAARLVAADKLSNRKIAQKIEIGERTLDYWKKDPEFIAQVEWHLKQWAQDIARKGIADQRRRLYWYNDRWRRLQYAITKQRNFFLEEQKRIWEQNKRNAEARAALPPAGSDDYDELARQIPEDEPDIPEKALNGLYIRTKRSVHIGPDMYETFWEYKLDTALMSELRQIEQQAAIEMGQWKERLVLANEDDELAESLAAICSSEELASLRQRLEAHAQSVRLKHDQTRLPDVHPDDSPYREDSGTAGLLEPAEESGGDPGEAESRDELS